MAMLSAHEEQHPPLASVLEAAHREVLPTKLSYAVDGMSGGQWELLLAGFSDALCDQAHCYAAELWGAERVSHVVVDGDDGPVAAAQVVLLGLPGVRSGLAYVKFGPLWRRQGHTPDRRHLAAALEALIAEYVHRRRLRLVVLPPADPLFGGEMRRQLEGLGFCRKRQLSDPNRYLVDLSLPEDSQLHSLGQKWRYNLRKAQQCGIEVAVETGPDALATFCRLYQAMVERKRFRDSSGFPVLGAIWERLPGPCKPHIVLGYHNGHPVIGAVVVRIGDTATYLFGASDHEALGVNAGYALHWWIVGWLSRSGARWYDLGGEAQEPGLRQFKRGLVGKLGMVETLAGEYEYGGSLASRACAELIFAVRAARARLRVMSDAVSR